MEFINYIVVRHDMLGEDYYSFSVSQGLHTSSESLYYPAVVIYGDAIRAAEYADGNGRNNI